MNRIIILFSIFFLFECNKASLNQDDSNSILLNIGRLYQLNQRLTVSGTAVKGIIKNANVTINPLNKDGSCNTSTTLATGSTDESGNYSLVYNKTGGTVCLSVHSNANGKATLYDEKTQTDISIPASSTFNLVTVLPESRIIANSRTNAVVSPFSKLINRRLQYLIKQAGDSADTSSLYKKASKEIVIRFGLNSGISSISSKALLERATTSSISDTSYPELDDILLELDKPDSPLSAKFITVLVGFSQLANKYKKGTTLTVDDIDAIIEAFAVDFEDGLFDGKTITGSAITMGQGSNQITLSSTPLTTTLQTAIVSYFQEGGNFSVGRPSSIGSTMTLSSSQILTQIQFVDNTPINPTSSATGTTLTADAAIAADKASLAITYAGSDLANSVTQNITLPTTGANGTTIAWTSSNANIISNTGTITRSIFADSTTTLTATISKTGGTSDTKVFTLIVIKRDATGTTAFRVYGQPDFVTNSTGISATKMSAPIGIDQDASGLYVADSANNRVLFFPTGSTTATRVYGQNGSFSTGTANNGGISANSLNTPIGIAVDSTGLYVADSLNNRVLYFAGTSTTATRVYGQAGSFTANTNNNGGLSANSISMPYGLAVDSTGVYVADTNNQRVLWYAGTSTTATRVYGQSGSFTANASSTTTTGLWGPNSIALDSAGVYICEGLNNHRALFFSGTSTTATRVYGQGGVFTANTANNGGISANSVSNPNAIAVDSTGVYIGDYANNRVLFFANASTTATRVYGQAGSFATVTANNGGISASSISGPRGVKTFTDGVYIVDTVNNRVLVY
ncbi:MAG TPA: NHL repeat-containing protein [Leptospiraceae bacterium]|nr:NHL repeat-containing protein [Leptospiraceae bacterium]